MPDKIGSKINIHDPYQTQSSESKLNHSFYNLFFIPFFMSSLIAPVAIINKIFFIPVAFSTIISIIKENSNNIFQSRSPIIISAIFIYGFCISLVGDSDITVAIQLLSSTFILFIVYSKELNGINLDKIVEYGCYVIILSTLLFRLTIDYPGIPFSGEIYKFLSDYNSGSSADRNFFESASTSTLQLGTTPFLFAGICIACIRLINSENRKYSIFFIFLLLSLIVASGQRGLIAISFIYIIYIFVCIFKNAFKFLAALFAITTIYLTYNYLNSESFLFSRYEISNSVKIGHLESFIDQLTIWSVLFGRGLASFYYSVGSLSMKSYTELTPVDFFRYFGIPLTFFIYKAILLPFGTISQALKYPHHFVAMILYIVLSASNPVMFNSYGLLFVLWYWKSLSRVKHHPPHSNELRFAK